MFCARCGQQIPEALGLCPVCGLQANAPAGSAPSAPPPAAASPAPVALQPPPAPHAGNVLGGVGGWLLFFCISFTILWPLWQLAQYALYHFAFRGPFWWLGPLRLVFGIVVGAMLWTGKPVAMQALRVYFVYSGGLALWSLVNWVRILGRLHSDAYLMSSFIVGLGSSLAFLAIGLAYFSTSERVRATYGSKLF
jgi:hypothetical protein